MCSLKPYTKELYKYKTNFGNERERESFEIEQKKNIPMYPILNGNTIEVQ